MKKVILGLGLLLAVGGGCAAGGLGGDKKVEGDWFLAFDLPSGWVMTDPYQEPNTDDVTPSQDVNREDNEIFLQTTDKAIVTGGVKPDSSVPEDSYVVRGDGYSQIRASRLDPARLIPSEAEDLGDGFFRVKLCEAGEDCQIYGHHNYDYYLDAGDAKYKFILIGGDVEEMIDIVTSAKVVTETEEAAE